MTKGASSAVGTVVPVSGFPASQSVKEYCVAASQDEMVYPGVEQCLTITAISPEGLVGTHISPGCEKEQIRLHFQMMMAGGARNAKSIYLVGNFGRHAEFTKVGWKSPANVVKDLKKYLSTNSPCYVFDTTDIAKRIGGFGIDIIAKKNGDALDYTCRKAMSRTATIEPIYGPFIKI